MGQTCGRHRISDASDHDKSDTRQQFSPEKKKVRVELEIFPSVQIHKNANDIPPAAIMERSIAKCDNNFIELCVLLDASPVCREFIAQQTLFSFLFF
jgi:hypothetical protein